MNAGPDPDGFMDFFAGELAAPLRALTPAAANARASEYNAVASGVHCLGPGSRQPLGTPGAGTRARHGRNKVMAIILLVLLLAIILGGLALRYPRPVVDRLVVLGLWLLGFLVRVGEGGTRSRWYRW